MSLLDVRKRFVRTSGRYDLVVDAVSFFNDPNGFGGGADQFIQDGQKFLDNELDFSKSEAELEVSLSTNSISSTLLNVRAIRAVALFDSTDEEMVYLERSSIQELREVYGDENSSLSNVETGQPHHWAIGFLRDGSTSNPTTEALGTKLITMPPADRSYTLRVQALLFSSALTNDASVSFWTEAYPQLLVWAALYQLEVGYRNFQGAQTLLAHIREGLEGIDNNVVEQELIGGSHAKDQGRFIRPPRQTIERHIG